MTNFVTSQTTGINPVCFFCGRPIIGSVVPGIWGGEVYHPECVFAPSRQTTASLTEEDVRKIVRIVRIVREELTHSFRILIDQNRITSPR